MIRGKVVLLPFPFDDLSATKVRPAICLTEPIGLHRHVVVAFITSQIPAPLLDSDLVLDEKSSNFATTGLRVSSVLRLHRLMTIAAGVIQRELGELPPAVLAEVDAKLKRLFCLK
jgi:mRNA interferase MazF